VTRQLYSVEQVAELLDLHVRTVRGYVRDGRLKATRIGKQYRIAAEDLEAFTGRPLPAVEPVRRTRHVEVSSVVEIDAISPEAADRVTNMMMAAAKGADDGQPLRIDSVYDRERGRLKVIVLASMDNTLGMLKIVRALTSEDA
jgi:excisionase family DNA binding protein